MSIYLLWDHTVKVQGHESQKSIADVGLCTLVGAGFFLFSLWRSFTAAGVYILLQSKFLKCTFILRHKSDQRHTGVSVCTRKKTKLKLDFLHAVGVSTTCRNCYNDTRV